MRATPFSRILLGAGLFMALAAASGIADEPASPPKAFLDGSGPGCGRRWGGSRLHRGELRTQDLDLERRFGAHCTGQPVGVIRTKKSLTNFELVAQWRHLKSAGNSGIFVWASDKSLEDLKPGTLPRGGIEVQVLDHGYAEQYKKQTGKKADWFTTNGDVFPVGTSKMKPFCDQSRPMARGVFRRSI